MSGDDAPSSAPYRPSPVAASGDGPGLLPSLRRPYSAPLVPLLRTQYVDPDYAGGGYEEYFGEDAPGTLDCHSPDTTWQLLRVYRQEFYQFIEQISKHLW